jgi:hypothetical protein
MLIIVPAFLYALFLDDLLRYAADLQETVVSTPWDFTGQDYTRPGTLGLGRYNANDPPGGAQLVQSQARLMFCDHESSGDSYDLDSDCNSENHHKAVSGHVCWLNKDAHQVTCEPARKDVGDLAGAGGQGLSRSFASYKEAFGNNGGLFKCHARTVVENYLLPQTFLQEFSKEELAKKNWRSPPGKIHDNAQDGRVATAYFLAEQSFALVTDSWALNDRKGLPPVAVRPGQKSGQLYDRVEKVYQSNPLYAPLLFSVPNFLGKTISQKLLLGSPAYDDMLRPNVSLPEVSPNQAVQNIPVQSISQDTGSRGYFATPWRDGARNAYERTAQQRGNFYMGCRTREGC